MSAPPAGRRVVLLPGLDGTGALLADFISAAPADVRLEIHPLPAEPLDYRALAERLAPTLRLTSDTVVIAESYSRAGRRRQRSGECARRPAP